MKIKEAACVVINGHSSRYISMVLTKTLTASATEVTNDTNRKLTSTSLYTNENSKDLTLRNGKARQFKLNN